MKNILILFILIFIPNISYGKQFLFTCTTTGDFFQPNKVDIKFLVTYMVDTDRKTIIHVNSQNLSTGDKPTIINKNVIIISWNFPIVISRSKIRKGGSPISFQYFDFHNEFHSSSSFYEYEKKPYSQLYECDEIVI